MAQLTYVLCLFSLAIGCTATGNGTLVATLAGHDPTAWVVDSPCTTTDIARVSCNLDIYSLAIAKAAKAGAELIVLPEGYGTSGNPTKATFFEPMAAIVGQSLCGNVSTATASPQQYRMSCNAQQYNIAVAANFFVSLPNGTHRIQEVVYDAAGVVVSTYSKIRVIPVVESSFASSGPFVPTTFELLGRTWGILVCNDGAYPYYTGDWSQLDGLHAQGAETIVWSVGAMVPIAHLAASTAKKYKWNMVTSEDRSIVTGAKSASIVGVDGSTFVSQQDIALSSPVNYTQTDLSIRIARIPHP